MTRLAVGFGRGFPRIWMLPIGTLTLLLGIAASGRLSRSIVADLLAWWPIWIGLAVSAYLLRERKLGQLRVAGIVPLVALLFVGLFLWGHLAGWSVMPSSSQRLVGPETTGFAEASLQVEIDGVIEVRGGAEYLYHVEPVMRGGAFGIPGASEQVVDSTVAVTLEPSAEPGLYTYAGWDISLAGAPRWSLDLVGAVDADLTSLTIDEASVAGSGVVRLGTVDVETPLAIAGAFRLVIPANTPARVIGAASVPASWTLDAQGAVSPTTGQGWLIAVAPGASLTVANP